MSKTAIAVFVIVFAASTTSAQDAAQGDPSQGTDFAATWQMTPALQFDAGANLGLNDDTPRHQLYVGVSTRF